MHYRVALLAFCCVAAAAQAPPDGVSLTVVVQGQRVPATILRAMEREAQSVIAPAGVHLVWRAEDLPNGEVLGAVAIVQMRGKCTAAAPARRTYLLSEEPLGQTHISDGKILPFADLLCDAVRNLVERDLRGLRTGEREQLLGRAFGRVLAHELYHILSRTTDHGNRGLAKPEQSSTDLLAPAGYFAAAEERRMAESISGDGAIAGR